MVTSKAQKPSKKEFILIFLLTILLTRLVIYFTPKPNIIFNDWFHHFYIGLFFLILYLLTKNHYPLAITLGFIVDQLSGVPFYLAELFNSPLAPYSFWYYWSPYSLISTSIIIILSVVLIKKNFR